MLENVEAHAGYPIVLPEPLRPARAVPAGDIKVVPLPWSQAGFIGGQVTHSKRQSWSFAKVVVDDVQCGDHLEMMVRPTSPTLVVALEQVGGHLEMQNSDDHVAEDAQGARNGPLTFLPKGIPAYGQARPIRFLRRMVIQFDAEEFVRVTEQSSPRKELLRPHLMVSDERIESICKLIADECGEPGTSSLMYADSLILALMVNLSRWKKAPAKKLTRGGLAPWQLRRTQAYMMEHIAEPISLQVLADMSGVSLAHFSRAFKSSTGASPYQWLISSRIDKAKSYLLERSLPIAEISVALGFCDQAHLTRTFTKMVGATPLTWQRSRLT